MSRTAERSRSILLFFCLMADPSTALREPERTMLREPVAKAFDVLEGFRRFNFRNKNYRGQFLDALIGIWRLSGWKLRCYFREYEYVNHPILLKVAQPHQEAYQVSVQFDLESTH